jgi:Uma2 family endonuclease
MQIVLREVDEQSTLRLRPDRLMTQDEYWNFCQANLDLRIERTSAGDIMIMPLDGAETGYRNSDLSMQLTAWAMEDGRGPSFGSSTEFILPNGAAFAPDASWVALDRLAAFSKEQKRRFLPLCPDFVVELMSPSDRLSDVRSKMEEWMENGAGLGWLIDPDNRTVYVYRRGDENAEKLVDIRWFEGEGAVAGFRLQLEDIWAGL